MSQQRYLIQYGAIAAYQQVNGDGVIYHSETRLTDSHERPVAYPEKVMLELFKRFRFVISHPYTQREAAIRKMEDVEVWA